MSSAAAPARASAPSLVPTRARYVAVLLCIVLALVTYLDRVAISQAMPFISDDLGLTRIQTGWALAIFAYAYALFEIPAGWMADRVGPRKVLMRIVVWWSAFTAATGWAWNAGSLIVARGLFGAGEAGAFPTMTRALTRWTPTGERERAQAWIWLATRLSGAFTPIFVLWLITTLTWRRAFEVLGVIGVVWAVVFYRWFRDDPARHPSVNGQELDLLPSAAEAGVAHTGIPWRRIISHRSVWLLSLQYMCLAYGWWFYINWLPTYLRDARGTSLQMGALLAGLPLLLGGAGCLVSAWVLPRLARRMGSVRVARRVVAISGFAGASVSVVVFTSIPDPVTAMFVLGLAGFFNDLVMPAAWAGTMDVGGRYAGTVSAAMNTMGSVAGAFSVTLVGYLLAWTGDDWTMLFLMSASIYLMGAVCWLFLDAHTPVARSRT
jgi:MFS family permease